VHFSLARHFVWSMEFDQDAESCLLDCSWSHGKWIPWEQWRPTNAISQHVRAFQKRTTGLVVHPKWGLPGPKWVISACAAIVNRRSGFCSSLPTTPSGSLFPAPATVLHPPSIHDRFCGRSGDCGEARTLALPFFVRTPHAKWLKGWQKAKHSRRRLHATIPNETGQTAISTCTKAKELDEHEGFFGFHASRTCGRSKSSPRCPPSNRPQTEDPLRCAPEADVAPGEGPIRCRSIHVLHT
jgi:hypothetical protein